MRRLIRSARFLATALMVSGALTACTTHPPPVATPSTDFLDDWAIVLDRHVDDEGRIDFASLSENPAALERCVAHIAARSLDAYPTPEAELADHINAYNALAMYNVIVSGKPPNDVVGFFVFQRFDIGDGHVLNLYDYENDVIRRLGESRFHFLLNCMCVDCPRLPRTPVLADGLDERLDVAAIEFVNDPRHVAYDASRNTVTVSKIFGWFEADFLAESPTLIDYLNRYRDAPIPANAAVKVRAFDFTLNGPPPR